MTIERMVSAYGFMSDQALKYSAFKCYSIISVHSIFFGDDVINYDYYFYVNISLTVYI